MLTLACKSGNTQAYASPSSSSRDGRVVCAVRVVVHPRRSNSFGPRAATGNTSVVPSLMIARLKVQSHVLAFQQKGKKIEEKSNAPQKIRSPIISRGAVEMGTSRGPGFVVGLCYLLRTSSLASPDVVHPSPAFRLPRRARVSLHLRPRRGSESRHTRVVPRPPH